MLEFLAPRFFAEQALAASSKVAMASVTALSTAFGPELDGDEAMARLDGLYLRAVRGLPVESFDEEGLRRCLLGLEVREGSLWRWLMGELASKVGVREVVFAFPPAFSQGSMMHLYYLTHVVLIETDYLMKPVGSALCGELAQLEAALIPLIHAESWDLLSQCVMCLNRARKPAVHATKALCAAQRRDGSFAEASASPRAAAHCTAAAVLALAGALDLERSAP